MPQITTYGQPKITDAQKRAAAERLRELGDQTPREKVVPEATEEQTARRKEALLHKEELEARREQLYKNFYSFSKSWVNAALEFAPLSVEMDKVCRELGVPNTITDGIMHVGDGSGVIQDHLRHLDEVCDMFKKRYRATGFVDRDHFESPVGA